MTMQGINKQLPLCLGGLPAIALALGAGSAAGQELHNHDICHRVAFLPPDPLGDREGHALGITQDNCETVEGVGKGAVWNNYSMWEWDGTKAKELAGYGVARKAGATTTFRDVDGTLELTLTDGKVTGWTASGNSVVTMGTGDWASFNGKKWHWVAKSTGPMTSEANSTLK